jgi:hypothetical protein
MIDQHKHHLVFCRSLLFVSDVCVGQSLVLCVVFCRSLLFVSDVCVGQSLVLCVVFCRSLLFVSMIGQHKHD